MRLVVVYATVAAVTDGGESRAAIREIVLSCTYMPGHSLCAVRYLTNGLDLVSH